MQFSHSGAVIDCMPSLVSNSKVKVSHGNEIIGPCYELYNS